MCAINWVPSNDETVSLDPGYYHGGPTFQPSAKAADVHIDVDAEQPVRIAMVSPSPVIVTEPCSRLLPARTNLSRLSSPAGGAWLNSVYNVLNVFPTTAGSFSKSA